MRKIEAIDVFVWGFLAVFVWIVVFDIPAANERDMTQHIITGSGGIFMLGLIVLTLRDYWKNGYLRSRPKTTVLFILTLPLSCLVYYFVCILRRRNLFVSTSP
jgi:hypothetical protein